MSCKCDSDGGNCCCGNGPKLIPIWTLEYQEGEVYESLTDEQKEFADFYNKMDYEGGIEGLLGHSGTQYFPERLKNSAQVAYEANKQLDKEIQQYAEELGLQC